MLGKQRDKARCKRDRESFTERMVGEKEMMLDKNIMQILYIKRAGLWIMTETWVTAYRKIGIGKTDYRRRWLFIYIHSWYNYSSNSNGKTIVNQTHLNTVFIFLSSLCRCSALHNLWDAIWRGRGTVVSKTFWPKSNIPYVLKSLAL